MFQPIVPLIAGAIVALIAVVASLRPLSSDANPFYV